MRWARISRRRWPERPARRAPATAWIRGVPRAGHSHGRAPGPLQTRLAAASSSKIWKTRKYRLAVRRAESFRPLQPPRRITGINSAASMASAPRMLDNQRSSSSSPVSACSSAASNRSRISPSNAASFSNQRFLDVVLGSLSRARLGCSLPQYRHKKPVHEVQDVVLRIHRSQDQTRELREIALPLAPTC